MATRSYVVDFFQATTSDDVLPGLVADFLVTLTDAQEPAVAQLGAYDHEIRNLGAHNHGATFTGVFAKYRHVDLPTARTTWIYIGACLAGLAAIFMQERQLLYSTIACDVLFVWGSWSFVRATLRFFLFLEFANPGD